MRNKLFDAEVTGIWRRKMYVTTKISDNREMLRNINGDLTSLKHVPKNHVHDNMIFITAIYVPMQLILLVLATSTKMRVRIENKWSKQWYSLFKTFHYQLMSVGILMNSIATDTSRVIDSHIRVIVHSTFLLDDSLIDSIENNVVSLPLIFRFFYQ